MRGGLPYTVKEHLEKAKDSALLAVEIYNKQRTAFKTAGYVNLIIDSPRTESRFDGV